MDFASVKGKTSSNEMSDNKMKIIRIDDKSSNSSYKFVGSAKMSFGTKSVQLYRKSSKGSMEDCGSARSFKSKDSGTQMAKVMEQNQYNFDNTHEMMKDETLNGPSQATVTGMEHGDDFLTGMGGFE